MGFVGCRERVLLRFLLDAVICDRLTTWRESYLDAVSFSAAAHDGGGKSHRLGVSQRGCIQRLLGHTLSRGVFLVRRDFVYEWHEKVSKIHTFEPASIHDGDQHE